MIATTCCALAGREPCQVPAGNTLGDVTCALQVEKGLKSQGDGGLAQGRTAHGRQESPLPDLGEAHVAFSTSSCFPRPVFAIDLVIGDGPWACALGNLILNPKQQHLHSLRK